MTQCFQQAVSSALCASLVDVDCFCNRCVFISSFPSSMTNHTNFFSFVHFHSQTFTSVILTCMIGMCPSELTSAEELSQRFCNIASPSVSLSFPISSVLVPSSSPHPPLRRHPCPLQDHLLVLQVRVRQHPLQETAVWL